jgi:transcriptional regulator with XRE-family HTH domain
MSQLDLSAAAGVTPRHVSFVETGRSSPSRQMLDTLADTLDMPLRDRNDLYLAAGYAAPCREVGLDREELAQVMAAVERILASHDPLPAVLMDRHWNLLQSNRGATELFGSMIDLEAIDQPANVLRLVFDPEGLRPHISNWDELAPALIARARREAVGGVVDPELESLLDQLVQQLPERANDNRRFAAGPVIDVAFQISGRKRRFFSTVTTLGTPTDVSLQELRIELFHPFE